ncbi:ABC transporter permease [Rapidithrix thailandica]|uniref:ABC transporter permease n=1 Tax=Rapidithrix thailandica TaxID=413964 RepID=A0AAW9SDU6_9BACT
MTNLKRLKGFIKKEFIHIFRDKRTMVILFGMPIVQILLFGFAITNEIQEARIAILDMAKDPVSEELSQKIMSSGYFHLQATLQHPRQIEEVFKRGEVKQVIVFPHDLDRKLEKEHRAVIQLIADASDPNTGTSLMNYTSSIIRSFQQEKNQTTSQPYQLVPEVQMRYNPELKGVYMFVPGLITIILMLVSAMMTSITITREKELGTMEVLLASPMKPGLIIIAKVIPYIFLSFINALMILFLGKFVFGVPIKGSLVLLLGESLLFILTALSLGIFISTKTQSQQVALMVSLMGLMLPVIILSGFIFPIENMPFFLQLLSNIIPAKWFIIIVKGIMLKGAGMELLWKESLILLGFTAFFILLSIKNFKTRLA